MSIDIREQREAHGADLAQQIITAVGTAPPTDVTMSSSFRFDPIRVQLTSDAPGLVLMRGVEISTSRFPGSPPYGAGFTMTQAEIRQLRANGSIDVRHGWQMHTLAYIPESLIAALLLAAMTRTARPT